MGIASPSDFAELETHGRISAEVRAPWAPARLNVALLNGRQFKKISPRPARRHSAIWEDVDYREPVFGDKGRDNSTIMPNIPIAVPGAQQRSSRATNQPRDQNDWIDWKGWPAGGWDPLTGEDWGEWHRRQETKNETTENPPKSQLPPSAPPPIPEPVAETAGSVKTETAPAKVTVRAESPPVRLGKLPPSPPYVPIASY